MKQEPKEERSKLQRLLDQQAKQKAQLAIIMNEIDKYETKHLSQWQEGNYKIGWCRRDLFVKKRKVQVRNRDKLFSLSSINSEASHNLEPIQDAQLRPIDQRFDTKKIKKNIRKTKRTAAFKKRKTRRIFRRRGKAIAGIKPQGIKKRKLKGSKSNTTKKEGKDEKSQQV